MKIAVTGASGFIGRHVLVELSKYNHTIIAVTRDSKRLRESQYPITIVEMDISQPALDCFERMGRPDVLIHLAWDGLPNYKSLHHFETELPRQYQFIKLMVENGLKSLVITGTCFEYGMQSGLLSTTLETKPNNPYGFAKDALRKQLEFLKLNNEFHLTWARLFYMYGEGQSSTSLYSLLHDAVKRGDQTFNMSGGEQLRDYLPVTEVARQLCHLAIKQQNVDLINICSGNPISVRRLIETWLKKNDYSIKLNFGSYPYPDYEPMAFWGELLEGESDRYEL